MRKFLAFLHRIFTPKFRVKFITPNGIKVCVSCTYGQEYHFKKMVISMFPFIDNEEYKKIKEAEEEQKDILTGMYYE